MNAEDCRRVLSEYFSQQLGYPIDQLAPGNITVVPHPAEAHEPDGTPVPDIRIMLIDDRGIAAVRADLKPAVEEIVQHLPNTGALLTLDVQSRLAALVDTLPRENRLQVLYAERMPDSFRRTPNCRRLELTDLYSLSNWFRLVYPGKNLDLVMQSAERSIREGLAFAAYQRGKLVAVARTLLPKYLEGQVEDIVIRTIPEARRQGFATALVALQAQAILALDRVPMYRCNWHNEASLGVALKLGFRRFASQISFMRSECDRKLSEPLEENK